MPETFDINSIYILFYLMIGCTIALVASIFDILKAYSQNKLDAEMFFETIANAFVYILFFPIPLVGYIALNITFFIGDTFEKIFSLFKRK